MRTIGKVFSGIALGLLFAVLAFSGIPAAYAQEKGGFKGWEKGGEYDKHYNPGEQDDFKGTVESVGEIVPLPGMDPGIGIVVKDQDGDTVNVQLGPKSFVNPDSIGLKKGDKVKVKGAWTELGGKEVFLASKVKKGENIELKVRRTKDGVPFWSLSPEELAKERE